MFFDVFLILEIAFDQYILCVLWKKQQKIYRIYRQEILPDRCVVK